MTDQTTTTTPEPTLEEMVLEEQIAEWRKYPGVTVEKVAGLGWVLAERDRDYHRDDEQVTYRTARVTVLVESETETGRPIGSRGWLDVRVDAGGGYYAGEPSVGMTGTTTSPERALAYARLLQHAIEKVLPTLTPTPTR